MFSASCSSIAIFMADIRSNYKLFFHQSKLSAEKPPGHVHSVELFSLNFCILSRTVALYKRFHEQWFPITTIWNYSCLKSIVISPRCPHNISPLTYSNNTLTRTPVSNFEWLFDLYCVNKSNHCHPSKQI